MHDLSACGNPKLVVFCIVIFLLLLSVDVSATNYYLSPNGSDANSGSSITSPWKTFAHAIPRLQPGDTLVLGDGIYNGSNSGYPNIKCGTNAKSGTQSHPITVRSQNERQAWLKGAGEDSYRFALTNCSWWRIEGLRISDTDNNSTRSNRHVFLCSNCTNVTLRRGLLHNNNRYKNAHLILLANGSSNVIEESEFYLYHRHAINIYYSDGNTVRRVYCNSRNRPDIAGGYVSSATGTGEMCVTIYPGSNNVIENVFCEGTSACVDHPATATNINNRHFGVIALSTSTWPMRLGLLPNARGATLTTMPRDITCENCYFKVDETGFHTRASKGNRCDNCTFDGGQYGIRMRTGGQGDGNYSFFVTNSLFMNQSVQAGQQVISDYPSGSWSWTINKVNRFKSANFNPTTGVTNQTTTDPALNACPVFIRDGSPMKGAGIGGADIGANILFAYENGVLTNRPFWDPGTKQIRPEFRGATVKDASLDTTTNSIHDFGSRLHPNCTSWPAGYGLISAMPLPPGGLQATAQ